MREMPEDFRERLLAAYIDSDSGFPSFESFRAELLKVSLEGWGLVYHGAGQRAREPVEGYSCLGRAYYENLPDIIGYKGDDEIQGLRTAVRNAEIRMRGIFPPDKLERMFGGQAHYIILRQELQESGWF